MRKLLRRVMVNDLVIAMLVLVTVICISAVFWFVIAWLVYKERYGIGFLEYVEIFF